jgi:flagellar motility protein MotE (MotC chaperone)
MSKEIFQYWYVPIIIGLGIWIYFMQAKVTELEQINADYKASQAVLEQQIKDDQKVEKELRERINEIGKINEKLIDIYDKIKKDGEIPRADMLAPNSSWEQILRPIRAEFDSYENGYGSSI